MKATGIVRRIDDLGRVVIPKEIRRTLKIREGDPLEIFTDREGSVVFRKYSPIGEIADYADQYTEVLFKMTGMPCLICDSDRIVAASGIARKEAVGKPLSARLEELIRSRDNYVCRMSDPAPVYPGEEKGRPVWVMYPILSTGDVMGAVVLLGEEANLGTPPDDVVKLAQMASLFLGRQIES